MVGNLTFKYKKLKVRDIYRQICETYVEKSISEGMVEKCVMFNGGRNNVHDFFYAWILVNRNLIKKGD